MPKKLLTETEVGLPVNRARKIGKKIVFFLVLLVACVLLLNVQYFKKQIQFAFFGPMPVVSSNSQLQIPANAPLPVETMEKNTLVIESLGITAPIIYPEEKKLKLNIMTKKRRIGLGRYQKKRGRAILKDLSQPY